MTKATEPDLLPYGTLDDFADVQQWFELAMRVDARPRLPVPGLLGLDGAARALDGFTRAGALLLQRSEARRERFEPRLERVDLEVVLLHGQERLDVRIHGGGHGRGNAVSVMQ